MIAACEATRTRRFPSKMGYDQKTFLKEFDTAIEDAPKPNANANSEPKALVGEKQDVGNGLDKELRPIRAAPRGVPEAADRRRSSGLEKKRAEFRPAVCHFTPITWTFLETTAETEVTVLQEQIPRGVWLEDNEAGSRSTLRELAAFVA
jgi:hypothetical protein